MSSKRIGWDNVVALSYAAEQLFMAAQLLTSNTVPVQQAVTQTCDEHLCRLLDYRELLPEPTTRAILECLETCARMRGSGQIELGAAQRLAGSIRNVLGDIHRLLAEVDRRPPSPGTRAA